MFEAGLRTGNMQAPWPEEANRVLTTDLATLHFVPTALNRENLLREGISSERIYITGNTVIDALFLAVKKVHSAAIEIPRFLYGDHGSRVASAACSDHRASSRKFRR